LWILLEAAIVINAGLVAPRILRTRAENGLMFGDGQDYHVPTGRSKETATRISVGMETRGSDAKGIDGHQGEHHRFPRARLSR